MNKDWTEIREAAESLNRFCGNGDWESEVAHQQLMNQFLFRLYPDQVIRLCDEHHRVCAELETLKRAMRGMAEAAQIVLGKEGSK